MKTNEEMMEVHRLLGCVGCRYADKEAIGKRACCTHIQGPKPEWAEKKLGWRGREYL